MGKLNMTIFTGTVFIAFFFRTKSIIVNTVRLLLIRRQRYIRFISAIF